MMTALSQLKAKTQNTRTLYFKKYRYRLSIRDYNLNIIRECDSYEEYLSRCAETTTSWEKFSEYRNRGIPVSLDYYFKSDKINHKLIQCVYELMKNDDLKFYITRRVVNIYTNDLSLLSVIDDCDAKKTLYESRVMPIGVMTFSLNPPGNYRVYLTGTHHTLEQALEFEEHLLKNSDKLRPSKSLLKSLARLRKNRPMWGFYCDRGYYIDYDDDRNLMMLHLLFPKTIGKHYRLEQRDGSANY